MPVMLHVDQLEPGMRLYQAIFRESQILIPAGKILAEWEINSLRRRFSDLTVRVSDPVLDDFIDFEDDSRDSEVAWIVTQRIGSMMRQVRDKIGNQTALGACDVADLQSSIQAMIEFIKANPVTAAMIINSGYWSDYLQGHAANIFYISMLIGNAIRDYIFRERHRGAGPTSAAARYSMDLTPLAMGSFFHDLGMVPLADIYNQKEPLTAKQVALIREHPHAGANMLPPNCDSLTRMIVHTHHENANGTGYPQGIGRDKLHILSRIVRVADAYDAATSERVYKRSKSPARVLWEMTTGLNRSYYDPIVVKMLVSLIQPFPVGAKLRLDDGPYAVVVRHNRKHPFRPVVMVAYDEAGRRLTKDQLRPPVDLSSQEKIRITRMGNEDMSFLGRNCAINGDEPEPTEAVAAPNDDLFALMYP